MSERIEGYEITTEIVWPDDIEPLSVEERQRLAKKLDEAIMADLMAMAPPQPETTLYWPPWSNPGPPRCPNCGPIFQCVKHMVAC